MVTQAAVHREIASPAPHARSWWRSLLTLTVAIFVIAGGAGAMEPAQLTDAELNPLPIQFVSLRDGRLSYFDEDRRLTSAEIASHVSLTFASEPVRSASTGRLLLSDGHDLPGQFVHAADDRITWRHAELGELTIDLDDVLVMTLGEPAHEDTEAEPETAPEATTEPAQQPEPAEPLIDPLTLIATGADDRVVLRNGDVLTGFIESVETGAITLDVGGQTLPLAWERVAAVALANPLTQQPGNWVTLRDGARIRVTELAINSDEVTGQILSSQALQLPAGQVASVEFAQRHRLVSLAELDHRVVAGGTVFGVEIGPTFERSFASLHAPVVVAIDLPSGAQRFTARASLEDDALAWADLKLVVRDAEGEQFQAHLNRDQPGVLINVALSGDRLILELEEAANGPVMDRLRLRHAAVLLEH
ncbi:MAG: hypothetical protein WD294_10340 [Phycisphaeraceae bacterium]